MTCGNETKQRHMEMTQEERDENFSWMYDSYHNAIKHGVVQCRGCWEWLWLKYLFRCFHCGSYFCTKCGYDHFGPHPRITIIKGR